MINIIHIADVHLGAKPDSGYPWSKKRQQDIVNSFTDVIDTCREEKTDLLLIAGDLFHKQPLKKEIKEICSVFATIPDTTVVFIAGNHDAVTGDSFYPGADYPDNVIPMLNTQMERVDIKHLNLSVYGFSYDKKEITENRYDDVVAEGGLRYNILLGHGGDEKHIPIHASRLSENGFDYVALGHIHKPQILIKDKVAYSGALEPIDCNDFGPHGYIKIKLDKRGAALDFINSARAQYKRASITIRPEMTQSSLEQYLSRRIMEEGVYDIYHLTLLGLTDADFRIAKDRLYKIANIVSITDNTRPDYDLDKLYAQYRNSLIGDYIEELRDGNETEQKALYYGLRAMLGD